MCLATAVVDGAAWSARGIAVPSGRPCEAVTRARGIRSASDRRPIRVAALAIHRQ